MSLLERLLNHYHIVGSASKNSVVTLSTNYRCHPAISAFVGKIFYQHLQLKSLTDDDLIPSAHPNYPSCFTFICSNVDETLMSVEANINELEAEILLKNLQAILLDNWPQRWGQRDLSKCCIMSPSRSQVSL